MTTGALVVMESAGVEKPKRTRKTHHKVRTGCLTCKIRRKKCDEAKPFCKRCTSTGRTCDGYETQPAPPAVETPFKAQYHQQNGYQQQSTFLPPSTFTDPNSPDSGVDVASTRGSLSSTTANQLTLFTTTTTNSSSSTSTSHTTTPHHHPSHTFSPPTDYLPFPRAPPSTTTTHFASPQDFHSFTFFQHRTGPEFAAYFDSSIWRTFMLRACFLHPPVLQAAVAVGAVHRRFELGISREAFAWCAVAERAYRRAVACLREAESGVGLGIGGGGGMGGAEVGMLGHMLLSIFETFQGNYESALRHMTKGLGRLLRRPTRTVHREERYRCVQVGYKALHELTERLEGLVPRYFGGRAHVQLSDPAVDGEPSAVPECFGSLEEARDCLFSEGVWVYRAWEELSLGRGMGGQGKGGMFARQHRHIARLLSWSVAYAEFTKKMGDREQGNRWMRRAAQLLKAYREALYLVLLTQMAFHSPVDGKEIVPLCFPPETCDCHRSCRDYAERKSALNAHLARVLVLCEALWDSEGGGKDVWGYEEHSISVDSGIGPPVLMGQTKCRSTKVRHQVTGLLSGTELRDQIYGKLGVYSVAEKLSSIEEHAVVAAAKAWRGNNRNTAGPDFLGSLNEWDTPNGLEYEDEDWFRGQPNWWIGKKGLGEPKWVDVTCFIEEGKLLVRHCREDELGGLLWTQEWATFA